MALTANTDLKKYAGLYRDSQEGDLLRLSGNNIFLVFKSGTDYGAYCYELNDWGGALAVCSIPNLIRDPFGIKFEHNKIHINPGGNEIVFDKINDTQLHDGYYECSLGGATLKVEIDGIYMHFTTPNETVKFWHLTYRNRLFRLPSSDMFEDPYDAPDKISDIHLQEYISDVTPAGFNNSTQIQGRNINMNFRKKR